MKKLLLILLCLPMIGFGQEKQEIYLGNTINFVKQIIKEKNNIGHINSQELLMLMPERKTAETEVANFAKSLEAQLGSMTAEYQESVQEYQANEATYTDLVKQDKVAEITGLEQRIQSFQQNAQQSLQTKEQELLEPILSRARNAIEYVALERNYDYIFDVFGDSKTILYEKGSVNNDVLITDNTTSKNTKPPVMIDLSVKGKIQTFVELRVNEWQQKGEFEKTNDYLVRVNEKNRTVKIKELQEAAIESLKLDFLNSIDFSNIELDDYDADNETFLLKDSKLGNLVIPVPINQAKLFKSNFSYIQFTDQKFVIIDDKFVLSYLELSLSLQASSAPKIYTYNLSNTQDYSITDIEYEFSAIEIDDIKSSKTTKSNRISTNKLKVGESSVNINIPTNKKVKHRYALVIGNEDYQSKQRGLSDEQNVDYAVKDASIFQEYALKTLGVKEENMYFLEDATSIEMNRKIKLVSKIIKKLGSKAELIVYYAGHGYPDETTKVPYLIPVDVPASDLSYAIKLDDFYKDMSATGAKSITVFLDACFTGGGRESGLVASRGVKVKPKEGSLSGNLVVFSASSGNQSALPYHDEGHGMFTYHLLKKLQESKGKVSMGELADYITNEVSIQSLKTNEKEQDPKVNTSSKVINDWRKWKF